MGILDEAIREHLELKRQHGADDSELKQLESEAFGAAERPGSAPAGSDAASEAPTEFMAHPGLAPGEASSEAAETPTAEASSRREGASRIADLQEPPEAPAEDQEEPPEGASEEEFQAEDEQPAAEEEQPVAEEQSMAEEQPVAEEQPAAETELPDVETEPAPPSGPSTEERHVIAEQPTQMFDVEEAMAETGESAPSEEQLAEEEMSGPRLGDAAAEVESEVEVEEDEDFWSEQRLSDELDQALEAPIEDEGELGDDPEEEEGEEEPAAPESPAAERHEPATEIRDLPPAAEENTEAHAAPSSDREEDVLEDTPDFLEESPEDDELWFEQKPPKDFDFDD